MPLVEQEPQGPIVSFPVNVDPTEATSMLIDPPNTPLVTTETLSVVHSTSTITPDQQETREVSHDLKPVDSLPLSINSNTNEKGRNRLSRRYGGRRRRCISCNGRHFSSQQCRGSTISRFQQFKIPSLDITKLASKSSELY